MEATVMQKAGHQSSKPQRNAIGPSLHRPNFIKLIQNARWEKYNTKNYSDFSYASFLETMEEVKNNTIEYCSDDFYKVMGIPTPDQYRAFIELYNIIGDYDAFAHVPKRLSNHARLPRYPGTIKLLKMLYDNFEKAPVKEIVVSCGSFYRRNLWVRYESIEYLNKFAQKGTIVNIYTNCGKNEDEDGINKLDKNITVNHLDDRVMIHFVRLDDYINIHFPHSEKILQRLSMLLKPEDFNRSPFKEKKAELFEFFDGLVKKASLKKEEEED